MTARSKHVRYSEDISKTLQCVLDFVSVFIVDVVSSK